jgi:pre-mRNA-processing factor 6
LFWADRKIEKAREWFNRALTVNADLGDTWANLYRFESLFGTAEQQQGLFFAVSCVDL